MYVGMTIAGIPVKISDTSPNYNLLISGISGSGKSLRIADIEQKEVALRKSTVIALDIGGTHPYIPEQFANRISIREDGLAISFLEQIASSKSRAELVSCVSCIVDAFSGAANLGVQQKGILREALFNSVDRRDEFCNDMAAIADTLLKMESDRGMAVHNKIWDILECGAFRKSSKQVQNAQVNIISLEGYSSSLQRMISEIFLSSLWSKAKAFKEERRDLIIVLDEFQNLLLGKNAILPEMLRECRKYNIKLILATQSLAQFPKGVKAALDQTAVKLYFRQAESDLKQSARSIDGNCIERGVLRLKNLKVGQSIAIGNLTTGRDRETRSVLCVSDYAGREEPGRKMFIRLI